MGYGFHFELPGKIIYYERCGKEEEARTKLEKMAIDYCRGGDLGIGEILRFEDGNREILSSYNYSFNYGELVMVESH